MSISPTSLDRIIEEKSNLLSVEEKARVLAFITYLLEKNEKITVLPERILGLNRGEIWTSDDFDSSLSDEFWLGES
ncbi:MAG: DUF2281 domain-containing protein [Microcystaceae cyanobacterium]